ncbi:RNA 2',3'-cyclic phosphodiesterase [archaeon]|nr:RNA 2',3'-cyclic phosphodiesterase [archaeon]|tara:strand:+ start:682 stop:1221 length:540 start_codon:yes stop_codon:yes gene_type:complete
MRLFISTVFRNGLGELVQSTLKGLESLDLDARFSSIDQLHLTLKFLGDISRERLPTIHDRLKEVTKNQSPFDVMLQGLTVFPNETFIRVVVVNAHSKRLTKLIEQIDKNIKTSKPATDTPHITLARITSSKNKPQLLDFITQRKDTVLGELKVIGIDLVQSKLTPTGPVHRIIEEYQFQ